MGTDHSHIPVLHLPVPVPKRFAHLIPKFRHLPDAFFQIRDFSLEKCVQMLAGQVSARADFRHFPDLGKGEPEILGLLDELKEVDGVRAIIPVSGAG